MSRPNRVIGFLFLLAGTILALVCFLVTLPYLPLRPEIRYGVFLVYLLPLITGPILYFSKMKNRRPTSAALVYMVVVAITITVALMVRHNAVHDPHDPLKREALVLEKGMTEVKGHNIYSVTFRIRDIASRPERLMISETLYSVLTEGSRFIVFTGPGAWGLEWLRSDPPPQPLDE